MRTSTKYKRDREKIPVGNRYKVQAFYREEIPLRTGTKYKCYREEIHAKLIQSTSVTEVSFLLKQAHNTCVMALRSLLQTIQNTVVTGQLMLKRVHDAGFIVW